MVSFIKLGSTNVFADSPLVFKTWNCAALAKTIDKICNSYEQEYEMKARITENIAHSRCDTDLTMHLAMWEYQTHVNSDVELLFRALVTEADVELDDKT